MKKYIILFAVLFVLVVVAILVRKNVANYTADIVEDFSRPYFFSYDGKIKRDTCTFSACIIIPNAQIKFFDSTLLLGDVKIQILPGTSFTMTIKNNYILINGNYLSGELEIKGNDIEAHNIAFALQPLIGTINGERKNDKVKVSANVINFKDAFIKYMPDINPDIPVDLAALFSNDPVILNFDQKDDWIQMDGIPLFKIR